LKIPISQQTAAKKRQKSALLSTIVVYHMQQMIKKKITTRIPPRTFQHRNKQNNDPATEFIVQQFAYKHAANSSSEY
jgi:hypothetical protein